MSTIYLGDQVLESDFFSDDPVYSSVFDDELAWEGAYVRGYREPRYPVPIVWKHPGFRVDFEFYFMRGTINAMLEESMVM